MHHVIVALAHQYFFGTVRVTVGWNVSNQPVRLFVERVEVFVIRDTQGKERASGYGNGRNDVHLVVKHHLPLLVDTVSQLVHLVGGTHHRIEVIQEKRTSALLGRCAGLGTINFGGYGIPRADEALEKTVVVAPHPSVYVHNMFHGITAYVFITLQR